MRERTSLTSRYFYRVLTVFFKYAISYFLIISIIFFTVGAYSYSSAISANEAKVKTEINTLLRESVSYADTGLYGTMGVITGLVSDGDVIRASRLEAGAVDASAPVFTDLTDSLAAYVGGSPYLKNAALFFFGNEVLVTADGVGANAEAHYDSELQPLLGQEYEDWKASLQQDSQLSWSGGKDNSLVQMIYFSAGTKAEEAFALSLLLDSALFYEPLQESDYAGASILVALNQFGEPFYFSHAEKGEVLLRLLEGDDSYLAIDGVNYDLFTGSSDIGLTYHLAVATDEIISINNSIRNGFVMVYVIVLLVTVGLSLVFAINMTRPITSILGALDRTRSPEEENRQRHLGGLGYINQSVSTLAAQNVNLQRELQTYTAAMRSSFFYKLLEGDPITQREIHLAGDDVSRIFSYNSFAVALIQFYSYEDDPAHADQELGRAMERAVKELGALADEGIFLHQCSGDKLAFILCGQKQLDRRYLEEKMNPMIRVLMDATKMDFACAVGDICENCDQIHISYQSACYLLGSQTLRQTGEINWAENDTGKKLLLNFSVDAEQRLINAICLGNVEQAREIVDLLFEVNYTALYLSGRQLSYFVSAMTVVFLRVCGQLSDLTEEHQQQVNLYLWQMRNVTDPESAQRYVYILIDLVSSVVAARGEQRSKNMLEKIMAHIDEHFAEDTLCLSSIAKYFNLTESYVSTFFKQQTDGNISLYIEKVRMEHAKNLVRGSNLPTKEVAARCGYQNLNTFYKAFKRNFGVSPKDFKNIPD